MAARTYTRSVIGEVAETGFRSLGQGAARRMALQSAQRDELGRTMLIHGPVGAGKTAFVDDLLALIFCADPDRASRPCNTCRGCRDARARTHPDLVVGSPEVWRESRSTGESIVAAARRWLLAASGAPVVASRRVVLLERVDRANEQTQNSLLKVLEEPTDRHTFILVADEPQRLLPTIRSRCRPLRVGPVPRGELVAYLMDRMRLPADQADTIAQLSGGLVGSAVGYVQQAVRLDWRRRVQIELFALLHHGRAERLAAARHLLDTAAAIAAPASPSDATDVTEAESARVPASAQREGALLVVDAWLSLSRDLLVACAGRPGLAASRELEPGQDPSLERIGERIGAGPLLEMVSRLEQIHDALRENAAPRLALEVAMLTWPRLAPPEPPGR